MLALDIYLFNGLKVIVVLKLNLNTGFKYGTTFLMHLFSNSFWIYLFLFSWDIVSLQLINFIVANDSGKQERRMKNISILLGIIRQSQAPSENRLKAMLNLKSRSPSLDLNPACPGRMP